MARKTLEEKLGKETLVELAIWYYKRSDTNATLARHYKVKRHAIPRLAKAGNLILQERNEKALAEYQKAAPSEIERG